MVKGFNGMRTQFSVIDPYFHVFLLLVTPLLLLAANPNWIFSPPGIDAWVSLGFFHNYPLFQEQLFLNTYYGSRLSWILPGFIAHHIFSPLIAHYVLHLSVYYTCIFSLYYILRKTTTTTTAFFCSILMAGYGYFLNAVGWDYVDGPGIAYYLLSIALLTRTAQSSRHPAWLLVSGLTIGLLIHTNFFWLIMSITVFLYYILAMKRFKGKFTVRDIFKHFGWLFLGILMLTMFWGLINVYVGGNFWFFRPSLNHIIGRFNQLAILGHFNIPWERPVENWLPNAFWLLLPIFISIASVFILIRYKLSLGGGKFFSDNLFEINFLLFFSFMLFPEFLGGALLQHPYYASYLIGPMFLALGHIFQYSFERLSKWQSKTLILGIIVYIILHQSGNNFIHQYFFFPNSKLIPVQKIFIVPIILGFLWLALINISHRGRATLISSLIIFFFFFSYIPQRPKNRDFRGLYLRVIQGMQAVEAIELKRRPRFWYNQNAKLGKHDFISLSSTYLWGLNFYNLNFPDPEPRKPGKRLRSNDIVVIPSQQERVFEKAEKSLRTKGISLRFLSTVKIQDETISYTLTFAEVVPDSSSISGN